MLILAGAAAMQVRYLNIFAIIQNNGHVEDAHHTPTPSDIQPEPEPTDRCSFIMPTNHNNNHETLITGLSSQ